LLLTEALRGEGAHVVDEDGTRFLFDYDVRGELASRDIVARGIFKHKRETGKQTYLDFSMFEEEWFEHRFPNITRTFGALGYDFPKDRVPISPAFHYANGGIKCDSNGCIEGLEGLYAIGEVAGTGVHGANRLASNSLLEGVVFAKRAVDHLLGKGHQEVKTPSFEKDYGNILHKKNDKIYKQKLRKVMWDDIGIIRTTKGLHEAKNFIYDMKNHEIGRLLQLRLNTASAIVEAALARKESLGSHYMESE
jgi:L-aspartate oxidase